MSKVVPWSGPDAATLKPHGEHGHEGAEEEHPRREAHVTESESEDEPASRHASEADTEPSTQAWAPVERQHSTDFDSVQFKRVHTTGVSTMSSDHNDDHILLHPFSAESILNGPDADLRALAFEMHHSKWVEITHRRIKRISYRDCFVGTQAIDFLTVKLVCHRREAIRVADRMLAKDLIQYAQPDNAPARTVHPPSLDSPTVFLTFKDIGVDDTYDPTVLTPEYLSTLGIEMMSRGGVTVKNRWWRFDWHESAFLGNEAVDWLTQRLGCSRRKALLIGNDINRVGIFFHVTGQHKLLDEPHLYRFAELNLLGDAEDCPLYDTNMLVRAGDLAFSAHGAVAMCFNIPTRTEIMYYEGHSDRITCVAYGRAHLYTASLDGTARQWNIRTGFCNRIYTGHFMGVTRMLYSWEEGLLYTASLDGSIILHNVKSNETVARLEGHTGAISTLLLHGEWLFSGSTDKSVRMWDSRNGAGLHLFPGHESTVTALLVDESSLYVGLETGQIHIWNVHTRYAIFVFGGHASAVTTLAWVPQTQMLYSGGLDGDVRHWSPPPTPRGGPGASPSAISPRGLESFTTPRNDFHLPPISARREKAVAPASPVVALRVFGVGELYAVWRDGRIIRADVKSSGGGVGAPLETFYVCKTVDPRPEDTPDGTPLSLVVSCDGTCLCGTSTCVLWERRVDDKTITRISRATGQVKSMEIDEGLVYTGSDLNSAVQVYDRTSAKLVATLRAHEASVTCIAMDSKHLYSGSEDGLMCVWSKATNVLVARTRAHTGDMHTMISFADNRVITANGTEIKLWRTGQKEPEHLFTESVPITAAFCSDTRIVTGHAAGQVVMRAVDGAGRKNFVGHQGQILCLHMHGNTLLTSALDSTVRAWDMVTGIRIARFVTAYPVKSLTVDVVRNVAYGGASSGTVLAWNVSKEKFLFSFQHHKAPIDVLHFPRGSDETVFGGSTVVSSLNLFAMTRLGVKVGTELRPKGGLMRVVNKYSSLGMYLLDILLAVIDTVQLMLFAFTSTLPWKELVKFDIKWLDPLAPLGVNVSMGITLAAMLLFSVIILIQEPFQRKHFLDGGQSSVLQVVWFLMRLACKGITRPLFVFIFLSVLKIFQCTYVSGLDVLLIDPATVCWQGKHLFFVIVAVPLLALFIPTTIRFLLVGSDLQCLELRRNVLDWTGDSYEVIEEHPFSYNEKIGRFFLIVLLAKICLSVATLYGKRYGLLIALLGLGVTLAVMVIVLLQPPHLGMRGNQLRGLLTFATVWVYICALIAAGDVSEATYILLGGILPIGLLGAVITGRIAAARKRAHARLSLPNPTAGAGAAASAGKTTVSAQGSHVTSMVSKKTSFTHESA